MHRQYGIILTSAEQFLGRMVPENFKTVTKFLADPYKVKGYKINIRRYLLAVCTGDRLRAYVHDDGKNIYTKLPYREPWEGEYWGGNESLLSLRQDELITTGYVPEEHYDDKPLSGLEFFRYIKSPSNGGVNPAFLRASMWARLALAVHASVRDGEFDLCTVAAHRSHFDKVPWCMHGAVRFQHFGCDFHVDSNLTGVNSRMFECNKGPDFSAHSYRDGKMKRDVAADMISFMGFKGRFDGSNAHAKRHRMSLIYDSETFDPEMAFKILNDLKFVDPTKSVEDNKKAMMKETENQQCQNVQNVQISL